jgi:dihydroorotase-like cyclic amidohydrolase
MKTNPQKIFGLPDQPETQVELDLESKWEIKAENQFTRCGWTPFEGWQVFGKVIKVTLHGETVYQDGQVLSPAGFGRDVRAERNS